jgi:hypothetical protein
MSQVIELTLDDPRRHLVEPPIVDHLYYEPAQDAYIITFVPSPYCSADATALVSVRNVAPLMPDFKRIGARLDQLAASLTGGRPIARIVHAGGGDFTFHDTAGQSVSLSDTSFDAMTTFDAYHAMEELGQVAETAYRLHALTSGQ